MNRLLSVVFACVFGMVPLAPAQTPPTNADSERRLGALMKEVRDQQAELAANQAKIDEKLIVLAEAIRQARIYSSRTGK